jgi:hypothetical protein
MAECCKIVEAAEVAADPKKRNSTSPAMWVGRKKKMSDSHHSPETQ